MIKKFFLLPIVLLFLIGLYQEAYRFYIQSKGIPEESTYVSSLQCQSCHNNIFHHWQNSLHAKMMRPIETVSDLSADISPQSNISFPSEQIAYVIGSKWEQQFMGKEEIINALGEKEVHETLLPGAWLIAKHEWMLTGWDGWQTPVPLQRCHGCHTVGLDVETGKFAEPSIGCESCHGPGSWHVETDGVGKIHTNIDSAMCGQCHSRGKSIDGKHFFPVNYKPWEDLESVFNESIFDPLQNTSHWWANGHARKRHQEYTAWKQGGHSQSLKRIKENYDGRFGDVTGECLTCHAGEAAIIGKHHGFDLSQVEQGVTCTVCHKVHGQLDQARMECHSCHGDGAYWHQADLNPNHVPCPPTANVQCVDCHMPLTGWNGGDYTLHSHSPGIIPPADSTKWQMPNSCANGACHQDAEPQWLQTVYDNFYDHAQ